MKTQEIREKFSSFFKGKGHSKLPSSSIIPHNDDTLLFANAGMNQFKDYFTGKIVPPNRRALTIQKCVRAGGKHNDLENVGLTARHHTYFEMLGNFSFGDYFKKEAIKMAWDFLTVELLIPTEKLYVTVHHSDNEAFEIWNKEVGISSDRIFKKGDKDNFWEMGEFGPCGPCSEIFYDHGEKYSTPHFSPTPDQDLLDDEMRYVEIWNLVFMQYEKTPEGKFDLPNPSIDTGMGLERLAACLQGVYWNYDTDVFSDIIKAIEKVSEKKYSDDINKSSIRIVADHIRSCTMLITDGVIPSNEGRGYVLRRIIRRAVRHLRELGCKEISFYKLIPATFSKLGGEYPQNLANQVMAEKFLQIEEKKFLETLDQGIKFLDEAVKKDVSNNILSGQSAFKLYDTYGFPYDLTETILKEKNICIDKVGFEESMQRRKEDSRKSWKTGQVVDDKAFHEIKNKFGATDFIGYEEEITESKLLGILSLNKNKALIFDKTPFYAEGGGQIGDSGEIFLNGIRIAEIFDTQKPIEDLYAHFSNNADALELNATYTIKINSKKRNLTKCNHSATHLLQAALIEVLGDHVKQAGSNVGPERLRFDFTHMQSLSESEIKIIEDLVNEKIESALEVTASEMSMDQAISKGAMALFGEKYGDNVRVLEMDKFSIELCGGTHVKNTKDIGLFTIISESSLSSGVRRIEATTSANAILRLQKRSQIIKELEKITSAKGHLLIEKVQFLLSELKEQQRKISKLNDKLNATKSDDLFSDPEIIKNKTPFISTEAPEGSDLRKLSDLFVNKYKDGILLLHCKNKKKLSILLRAGKEQKNIKCDNILNEALSLLNGRGGGRPDMAQGSAETGDMKIFNTKVKSLIESLL